MAALPTYKAPPGGRLTSRMLDDYAETGVLVLEDFVEPARCIELRDRIGELVDSFDPGDVRHVFSALRQSQLGDQYFEESGDKIRFFFEHDAFEPDGSLRRPKEQSLNKMGHAMHDLDPVFDAFSRTPELQQVGTDLGIADPAIIQSMVIFKPPQIGGEVHCHQDSTYIYTDPLSCVGFWFALEDATVENGCMRFIPGGHKQGLKERQLRGADGKLFMDVFDATPWPNEAAVPAEARTGTVVIFDGCAPHQSGPNHSSRSRCAYTLHVVDRACHYAAENWLQRSPDLPLRGFAG